MRKLLFVAVLALATTACGILYKQPIYQGNLLDKSQVEQLQPGLDKQQVLALLGTPSIADPFHNQRWDYAASQRDDRVGHVQVKDLTLWFENDTLARWEGEYFPEQDERLAKSLRKTFGYYPKSEKEKEKRRKGG